MIDSDTQFVYLFQFCQKYVWLKKLLGWISSCAMTTNTEYWISQENVQSGAAGQDKKKKPTPTPGPLFHFDWKLYKVAKFYFKAPNGLSHLLKQITKVLIESPTATLYPDKPADRTPL